MDCLNCSELSVIIPAYNCQDYIERCVTSVIACNPLEVIIVDDASSDNTYIICLKLSKRHQNVILISHRENQGVVSSRYDGQKISKGKYIAYIDADDWISSDFLIQAVEELECNNSIDVAVGRVYQDDNKGNVFPICKIEEKIILDHQKAVNGLFEWEHYRWELCGKVFRKSLIEGWIPDKSIKICEDLDSTWELFKRAKSVICLPIDYYHYYFNENGASYNTRYYESNSYKVFEKILKDRNILEPQVVSIVLRHYKKILINNIRECLVREMDELIIKSFQDKFWKMVQTYNIEPDEYDFSIFSEPKTAKEIYQNIRKELIFICNNVKGKRVFLYGTGIVSGFITEIMNKFGFGEFDYVVSDNQVKKNIFCGKHVYYLREISRDSHIILALNEVVQNEIGIELKKKQYACIYKIKLYGLV